MKLDKKLMKALNKIKEEGEELFSKIVEFTKEHKKLIILALLAYVVWRFLFDEDDE